MLHICCDQVFVKAIPRTTSQQVTQVNAHRRSTIVVVASGLPRCYP